MIEIKHELVNNEYPFPFITSILDNEGFALGSSWDWQTAIYDYPLDTEGINDHYYLRIVLIAEKGQIQEADCTVKIGEIQITGARYYEGVDSELEIENSLVDHSTRILQNVFEQITNREGIENYLT